MSGFFNVENHPYQGIKQKNRLFPQLKMPIVHAEIRDDGDRFSISAVSIRTE